MIAKRVRIDDLIEVVRQGGKVKTGIDVFDSKGVLLLEKDVVVNQVKTLEVIKSVGVQSLPLNPENYGGVWDGDGNFMTLDNGDASTETPQPQPDDGGTKTPTGDSTASSGTSRRKRTDGEIEKRLHEINELKAVASEQYATAKRQARKVLTEIKYSGGQFNYDVVERSVVELIDFFDDMENPFAYLGRDLFGYDDYLVAHCVNVCAVGSAILNRFNSSFSAMVNRQVATAFPNDQSFSTMGGMKPEKGPYRCYYSDEIREIVAGFFLHDIGKVLIPEAVLYKKGKLTVMEFDMIRKHSYQMGVSILEKSQLKSIVVKQIVQYHHARLFDGEKRCYPDTLPPVEIPPYVKMCKLADIYDAMISKQCYKEAHNPIGAVTDIFRKYAGKDHLLQFILHAFVKSIGIYPTGSIIYLVNGQMAYVLDSHGPLVIPFTDTHGETLTQRADPLDLGDKALDTSLKADGYRKVQSPVEVFDRLPAYLKSTLSQEG